MAKNSRRRDIVGAIASMVFALLSLAFSVHSAREVLHLETTGKHADAIVSGIKTGGRNSKTAVVSFQTLTGEKVETECQFQMFIIRHDPGDNVSVLYDPVNPQKAMIDNGRWNWDQPVFCLFGFLFLMALAVLIMKHLPAPPSSGV